MKRITVKEDSFEFTAPGHLNYSEEEIFEIYLNKGGTCPQIVGIYETIEAAKAALEDCWVYSTKDPCYWSKSYKIYTGNLAYIEIEEFDIENPEEIEDPDQIYDYLFSTDIDSWYVEPINND